MIGAPRLSPQQRAILELLMDRPMHVADLVASLYGADEDGGPDYADTLIRVVIHRMRRAGVRIETLGLGRAARGYRIAEEGRALADYLLAGTTSNKQTSTGTIDHVNSTRVPQPSRPSPRSRCERSACQQ